MNIRRMNPVDTYEMSKISAIAYEFKTKMADTVEKHLEDIKNAPKGERNANFDNGWGAFEDGKIIASMYTLPYDVMFDETIQPMCGIGGVCTLPHYRRGGAIRGMFEQALPEMYEKGQVFSYLFPFSTIFYRKFGYENSSLLTTYKILRSSVKQNEIKGMVKLADNDDVKKDVQAVYNAFINPINMAIYRDEELWENHQAKDPVKDNVFTYVWYNEEKTPKAYFTYRTTDWEGGIRIMKMSDFCFSDYDGFCGLLGFMNSFDTVYTHFEITLPYNMNVRHFFMEHSQGMVEMSTYDHGMARVVNVKSALENANYKGEGEINILVSDPFIEQNSGVWHVEFGGNSAKAAKSNNTPDIETDINNMSSLITGAMSYGDLRLNPFVKVNGNAANLEKAFYSKYIGIYDFF